MKTVVMSFIGCILTVNCLAQEIVSKDSDLKDVEKLKKEIAIYDVIQKNGQGKCSDGSGRTPDRFIASVALNIATRPYKISDADKLVGTPKIMCFNGKGAGWVLVEKKYDNDVLLQEVYHCNSEGVASSFDILNGVKDPETGWIRGDQVRISTDKKVLPVGQAVDIASMKTEDMKSINAGLIFNPPVQSAAGSGGAQGMSQ